MQFMVYVLSDEVLDSGRGISFENIAATLLKCGCLCSGVSIAKEERAGEILSALEGDSIVLAPNAKLDEIIIDNIKALPLEKRVVDEQVVVFEGDKKVIFIPLEEDFDTLFVKALDLQDDKKHCQFHLFGASRKEVEALLEPLKSEIDGFTYVAVDKGNLLVDAYFSYNGKPDLIDDGVVKVSGAVRNLVYSENDLSLEQNVFQLLSLKGISLDICEGITGGAVIASLFKGNRAFGSVLKSASVAPSLPEDVTAEKVYGALAQKLARSESVLGVCSQGFVRDGEVTCITAIGSLKGINVYKNTFHAPAEQALGMAKNAILFNMIKALRQKEFQV